MPLLQNWAFIFVSRSYLHQLFSWHDNKRWAGNHVCRWCFWTTALFKETLFLLCSSANKVKSKRRYKILCRTFFCCGICLDRHQLREFQKVVIKISQSHINCPLLMLRWCLMVTGYSVNVTHHSTHKEQEAQFNFQIKTSWSNTNFPRFLWSLDISLHRNLFLFLTLLG